MLHSLDDVVKELDGLYIDPESTVAMESYEIQELSPFFNDPGEYLDNLFRMNNTEYGNVLHEDGRIFCIVNAAANELIKVNAYTEALALYDNLLQVIEKLLKTVPKDKKSIFQYSIDTLKDNIIKTIGLRDEYTSKRKSVLSKYSDLLERLK